MDARRDQRIALGRRVSSLYTDPSFLQFLRFTAPDGTRPIVIATLEDRVGDVFDHVDRYHRGGANVIVGFRSGPLVNVIVRHDRIAEDAMPFGELEDDCPVHVDAQMAMLIAHLLLHEGQEVRCRRVDSREYEVDVVKVDDLASA